MMELYGNGKADSIEDSLSSHAPGSRPVPDQQGDLDICTRFAIGKEIVDAFDQKMAVPDKKIDLRQNAIIDILINEHNDGDGKWPTEFHLKTYTFRDENSRCWLTTLHIKEVQELEYMIEDLKNLQQHNTYVLVYPQYQSNPKGPSHCIFVERYFEEDPDYPNIKNVVKCINSDLDNPHLFLPVHSRGNLFYSIRGALKKNCVF